MSDQRPKRVPSIEERQDLLRSIVLWTGRRDIAEDLVQQKLFEAWRSDRQPERDVEWRPWLFGVARNVHLRWRRSESRLYKRLAGNLDDNGILEFASSSEDLDAILTSTEIVDLLDKFLGALPSQTRQALVLKYIADVPQAEIARRLGLNEKTIEGRLHRGKRSLRRSLVAERPDTVIELGLVREPDIWYESSLICPTCGIHHLSGRWFENGHLQVLCRGCSPSIERFAFEVKPDTDTISNRARYASLTRAILDVLKSWSPAHRDGIRTQACCGICNRPVTPRLEYASISDDHCLPVSLNLVFNCPQCSRGGARHTVSGSGLLTNEGQSFWSRHRSIRTLPARETCWHGIDAIESSWVASGGQRLITWYGMSTGALLAIEENGIELPTLDK